MLLHEVLKDAVVNFPDKIAVDSGKNRIAYLELDRASTGLSILLSGFGLGKAEHVAVLLDKSIEAVLTFLGVSKAGGCYIPLDVSAPVERLQYIFHDAEIRFVVTDSTRLHLLDEITKKHPVEHVVILQQDRGEDPIAGGVGTSLFHWTAYDEDGELPVVQAEEEQPAYILYTSGSTGNPKGVVLSHKNAVSFVSWAYRYFHIGNKDVLSSHAPFYFDLSIFDIYVALMAGAKLCLVPKATSAFPASLCKFIREKGISTWYSVPSVLVNLTLYGNLDKDGLPALKRIIYAGEAFPVKYLKILMSKLPGVEFYNLYGPTETNVITYYPIKEKAEDLIQDIPIGYTCPYAEIRVVMEDGREAAPGERGELAARGDSLMQGYLNNPELTGNVIRTLELDGKSVGDYYFTGDVVTVLEHGKYLYHGRKDHMVKVRGFRVELEEIEAALMKHGRIKGCLVQCVEDEKNGSYLRAFIECGSSLTEKDIVQFLKNTLPEYMIPYDIRFVEELKRNERGKIDRKKFLADVGGT